MSASALGRIGPLRLIARDIADGAACAARFVVTLVGCFTLVAGAVVVADARMRDAATRQFHSVVAALSARPAQAGDGAGALATEEAPAVEIVAKKADPAQQHVVRYLSRRYRVAENALRPVVAAAYESGRELGLDPLLILAVTAIESSLNPFAQSVMGAQGLMQVMTRVHAEKFEPHGGEDAALDPIANIKVGSAILSDLIRRGGSVERGLQLYVGAGNLPDDSGYAARVLAEHARLRMAAAGKVDLAVTSGVRAAAVEQQPKSTDPGEAGATSRPANSKRPDQAA
ncbi:MAG TPA: transglycosylase SLT domain-containing protein [Burkholderiaceae bacterium]|nr:transglycosylase SLT domain-containing protein [Burkholderiaceae bacterium]